MMLFWILGASFGSFMSLVAKESPSSKIYAFEPNPETVDLSFWNSGVGNKWNAKVFPYAVSGNTGKFRAMNGVLDLKNSGKILIKIDIEGAEYELLMNSPELLALKPTIVGEWHKIEDFDEILLWNHLKSLGYTVDVKNNYFCAEYKQERNQ